MGSSHLPRSADHSDGESAGELRRVVAARLAPFGDPARAVRYALVGLAVAALYLALATILSGSLGFGTTLASGISYLAAVTAQYLGHTLFTFGASLRDRGQLARFAGAIVGGSVASVAVTGAGEALDLPELAIFMIVMATAIAINFAALTLWVYVATSQTRSGGPR